jgi:hypothetical protein
MKVKIIIILVILLLLIDKSYSQTKKDTLITWYSIPCYDSVGNVTIYKKTFHHIPTRKDSLSFKWRRDEAIEKAINATIDTLKSKGYIKNKK